MSTSHCECSGPTSLDLCEFSVCFYCLCVFTGASVLYLEDTVLWPPLSSLALTVFLSPLLCRPLSLEGRSFDKSIPCRAECSKASHFLRIIQFGALVDSHLLQEVPLMCVEGGTDMQIMYNKLSTAETKWLSWLGVGIGERSVPWKSMGKSPWMTELFYILITEIIHISKLVEL